jgi:DNA repair protein RadC
MTTTKKEQDAMIPSWCKIVRTSPSAREEEVLKQNPVLCGRHAASLVEDRILVEEVEVMYVIMLDGRANPIGMTEVARGSAGHIAISVPTLFRMACAMGARSIILVHNHPSGTHEPSDEDNAMTISVMEAGHVLGITLLDHIIIARYGDHFSYSSHRPTTWAKWMRLCRKEDDGGDDLMSMAIHAMLMGRE